MSGHSPDLEVDDPEDATDGGEQDDDHLADVSDGAGCTEIWEHLSERRGEAD